MHVANLTLNEPWSITILCRVWILINPFKKLTSSFWSDAKPHSYNSATGIKNFVLKGFCNYSSSFVVRVEKYIVSWGNITFRLVLYHLIRNKTKTDVYLISYNPRTDQWTSNFRCINDVQLKPRIIGEIMLTTSLWTRKADAKLSRSHIVLFFWCVNAFLSNTSIFHNEGSGYSTTRKLPRWLTKST